jgi:hypothetical protein
VLPECLTEGPPLRGVVITVSLVQEYARFSKHLDLLNLTVAAILNSLIAP